jgi:HAD superfamily hydrolase (TIGR01509 family)
VGRGARFLSAAVAPRPSSFSPSPSPMTLSSSGVVGSSLLRPGAALVRPRRSDTVAVPCPPLSSPPRAASRRQRPRSAEAASAVTTAEAEAKATSSPPPPTRYYATDRRRRGPKVPGKGGGEEVEEEFSSPSSPSFAPPREKVGIALPLFNDAPKAMELPRAVESPADDPTLANPLQRLNRMSTGWMGVGFEFFEFRPRMHSVPTSGRLFRSFATRARARLPWTPPPSPPPLSPPPHLVPSSSLPLPPQTRLQKTQVIFECDGVTLPATPQLHDAAWLAVARAEGRPAPKRWQLRRADGMKGEQAVSEAFHWARAPAEVRRLARAKEEAFDAAEAEGEEAAAAAAAAAAVGLLLLPSSPSGEASAAATGAAPSSSSSSSSSTAVAAPPASSDQKKARARIFPVPGVTRFLETLAAHGVPAALASPERLERLEKTLAAAGLERAFAAVVAGDDVARCRPDAEPYLLAAARLGRPPSRCVLIGNSNASVEAARDAGMAVVAVAPRSASDAASAATAAAVAAGADAETAASAGRAAAAAAEASAGGPRAYELGAADLVVRGGLEGMTMDVFKSLFANEAAVEGRMGGDGENAASSSSSLSDDRFDDLDSRASPWSNSSSAPSSSSSSAAAVSDYGGLFDDDDDEDDDGNGGDGDADDDWRRRSRDELQLRR